MLLLFVAIAGRHLISFIILIVTVNLCKYIQRIAYCCEFIVVCYIYVSSYMLVAY